MAPKPSRTYERTDKEYANQKLSWERSDVAFFAAGACHILAFTFISMHPDEGYTLQFMRPPTNEGTHMYVAKNGWAFDFNGWSLEEELLAINVAAEREHDPAWPYTLTEIPEDLTTFCRQHKHRMPHDFYRSPEERAAAFINRFPTSPPEN